ncbi:MAG: DUF5694 domain-containing protein [Bacteroidota bacterium]
MKFYSKLLDIPLLLMGAFTILNCSPAIQESSEESHFPNASSQLNKAYNNFPTTEIEAKHKVLVLGTFHFNNASNSSQVKGKEEMDILSKENQEQLNLLLSVLKSYGPTKIAIELRPEYQQKIDSIYREYRAGRYILKTDEAFQLGFKLAKQMDHEKVYCVDNYTQLPETVSKAGNWEKYADSLGHTQLWRAYDKENSRFNSYMDSLKTVLNAYELIKLFNTKKYTARTEQTWVTGLVNLGHGDLYVGADLLGRWYKRNARIYANTINLIPKLENERLLIIYGAAHKSVLDKLFKANPEYELIQLEDRIRD